MKHSIRFAVVLAVSLVIFCERYASAYIDPGSGSMLLQLLLGGTVGVAMFGKLIWHRFKNLFRRSSEKESKEI